MAIIQKFDLKMIPDASPVVIHVDQYDVGTGRLVMNLIFDDQSYKPANGATALIQGTKPDGKGFSYTATISGNTVTANLTEQMTAVAGRVRVNVVVKEGSNRTGTFVFWLEVQKTGLADDIDLSTSELAPYMEAAKSWAEAAEKWAQIAKSWAVGPSGEGESGTDTNNAKYWAEHSGSGSSISESTENEISDITGGGGSSPDPEIKIVTWADGTDAEISAMIAAADKGLIDLTDYWHVNDERVIHVSAMSRSDNLYDTHVAQDIVFVLTHSGDTELVTPTEGGRSVCSFDVMMKGVLSNGDTAEKGIMSLAVNGMSYNAGGWADTPRRSWANGTFRNAIPASIRGIFKQFKCVSGLGDKSTECGTTNDYFALISECNTHGQSTGSYNDGVKWDYFENASYVKKTNNGTGTATAYYYRTPAILSSSEYCMETADGRKSATAASTNIGISLFGVI